MHREFDRNAARFSNAVPDALGKDQMVPVAWSEIAARLSNPDDWAI
jgi:hypothetical protein